MASFNIQSQERAIISLLHSASYVSLQSLVFQLWFVFCFLFGFFLLCYFFSHFFELVEVQLKHKTSQDINLHASNKLSVLVGKKKACKPTRVTKNLVKINQKLIKIHNFYCFD